jgi:histidine phosphotransferase ChpT
MLHPRVLELMASRVCHDLVSPVGAVNNGVELMEELGPAAGEEAVQLIANSARQASIRLKAFRLSYGAAGTDKNIGFKDIRDAFSELVPGGGRIQTEFAADIGVVFSMPPTGFFKVLLNLLVLAEECLHGEGLLAVAAKADKSGVTVTLTGKNPAFRGDAEAALANKLDVEALDARSIHAYLTGRFAYHFGLPLSWEAGEGRLTFTLGAAA